MDTVTLIIDDDVKYFIGDELTSPISQAILFLKEIEKGELDEQI